MSEASDDARYYNDECGRLNAEIIAIEQKLIAWADELKRESENQDFNCQHRIYARKYSDRIREILNAASHAEPKAAPTGE